MRFLLLSDIHGNVAAVDKLRREEANRFDAVIVAGDIGSARAAAILGVLVSFDCPVLYVYGNWDLTLRYDADFGPACHHLHLAPFRCGALSFAGFSGCPTHWGLNPIKASLDEVVRERHGPILDEVLTARDRFKRDVRDVEAAYRRVAAELAAVAQRRGQAWLRAKTERLTRNRDREVGLLRQNVAVLERSRAFQSYQEDVRSVARHALALNRAALAEAIGRSGSPAGGTIVITHERLADTRRDLPGVPLFLFGHRHRFADRQFAGARFVNVAALDSRVLVHPKQIPFQRSLCRNLNVGNYVVMTWSASAGFDVECVRFKPATPWERDWRVVEGGDDPAAPELP